MSLPINSAYLYAGGFVVIPAALLYFSALQKAMGIAGAVLFAGGALLGVGRGVCRSGQIDIETKEGLGRKFHSCVVWADYQSEWVGGKVKGFLDGARTSISSGFPSFNEYSTALKMLALGVVLFKMGNWRPL